MTPTEFWFRPYRHPVPYFTLLFLAVVILIMSLAGFTAAGLPFEASVALGVLVAGLAIGYIVHKDNRLMPAGVLRLEPGKLVFTARPGAPLELAPSQVKDALFHGGRYFVRPKRGAALVVHPARLDAPLGSVAEAVTSWMATSDAAEAFAAQSQKTERRENVRNKVLGYALAGMGIVRLLTWALESLDK